MKHILTSALMILLALPALAQTPEKPKATGTLVTVGEPRLSQEERDRIRGLMRILVVRDVAIQLGAVLELKGFSKGQIEELRAGAEFSEFAERVSHHPRVAAAVDGYIDFLIDDSQREKRMHERGFELRLAQETALRRYLLARGFDSEGGLKTDRPGFLDRLWNETKTFLFN